MGYSNVAEGAIGALAPAKLTWTLGHADFAVNRRENPEKKVPELRAANALKGPVDHELPVLTVTSGDSIKAIVFGYACHATTLRSQRCSGGPLRPEPRPVIRSDVQALERVTDKPEQKADPTTFVPAVRRKRLGTTIIDAPGPIGTCRADTLGNLRCR